MRSRLLRLLRLLRDKDGATALEYGLLVAAIAAVLMVIAFFAGGRVSTSLNNIAQHM